MKINILVDNAAGSFFKAEHGLSYVIEGKDTKLLFDTGQSDLFLNNASDMGIDLDDLNTIVLSHGHFDHGNGLKYLSDKDLVVHPDVFIPKYRKKDHSYIGLNMNEKECEERFNVIRSRSPYQISEDMIFLGEIPRIMDFESLNTPFELENGDEDFVKDDTAVVVETEKGLVIVTGCGHAGICNTIEYAKKITGNAVVYGVLGGFHLKTSGTLTTRTIDYLKSQNIKKIYPAHCTALPALSKFYEAFGMEQIKSGYKLHF